ncbi:hypothetical protein BEM40_005995 [Escherichia sp. MOD1-EC5451]|nr:hypothetical protein [Escherichia coli]PSS41575.1 hypothetical protein BEM40_005995 [Escherichia sp. MOD1-EC5451]
MTEIYIFCVCFVQPGFRWLLPPAPDAAPRRPDKPRLTVPPARHAPQKITHSGDSQPPTKREKSTMFLWNK